MNDGKADQTPKLKIPATLQVRNACTSYRTLDMSLAHLNKYFDRCRFTTVEKLVNQTISLKLSFQIMNII